ncbi:general stress protein [Peribacillus sp. NPDC096540]|uniref:general stress protein n=1 Tax=Peribacillus sp. NPDC096540 TaxID=3390612 RepID=UPI003CFD2690
MYQVHVVENGLQAKEKIDELVTFGYTKDDVYLFAHDKNRSKHLTENTNTEDVSMKEQGFLDTVGNLFKSRGDELRNRMSNLGLSDMEAERYEEVLDEGKVVIVASKQDNKDGITH